MAPSPQEPTVAEDFSGVPNEERVVISGMSGLYPQSNDVKQLENILYNKINPVTDKGCRWHFTHPEVSNCTGKISNLDRFDGQFFKVHYRLGNSMDTMSRKILEQAYQAIYDAGVSPEHLYGRKVGVYIGSCFSETEKACFYLASSRSGFGIAGCNKSMFANRISYWLNAKGPSMSIDDACCSSLAALEQAFLAIARGECEAAIVGGANLCLHPQSTVHYGRIINLSTDGKTKSFDQNAEGCAKSEAINVLFLQKVKDAKRVYAEVINVKNEFTGILEGETGPRYGFYRDPQVMVSFMKRFYEKLKVPPQAVEYIEAFGSAVPEADKAELEAIEEVYCKNRSDPLLVGSVMSNIGYGEAASGITAVTKVLLGYHNGEMAGNLHLETPRQDISAIRDGRMQILADNKKFSREYTAVNQISVTGINSHVLLHGHYKPKNLERYKCSMPQLVTISGRQDTAVQKILNDLKTRPIDAEELALLRNIHETRISGHLGRGYTILSTDEEGKTVSLAETASYFDDAKRPLWFVYSGMGSQWAGMGVQLMKIPVFAAAIERCRKVLEPKGVDIVHILTTSDKTIFDNILHSFVGIAAVQIGLTDVLTSLGIVPDKIIGHSVGELGCAYADGCFTAEEMILSAYSRGLVSVQTPFIRGSMAAVGLGYQQIIKMVPPEIVVACHNGPESSTISGPADVMKEFVTKLSAQGVFAKEVPCSNIAYHSKYIAEAGPGLLKYLSLVITNPKPRSARWLSSSVPEDKWDEPIAKLSSAEYHTNNLLSSVLFEETSRHIPANAVCIEIAPHGLLQAILKRSLPESCKHIPMTRRGHPDNMFMVLDAIGKLFMEGYNPKVQNLYPKVEFPVSTGTPMLSHLIEWAHHEKWSLPLYLSARRKMAAAFSSAISVHDDEYSYLQGHVLRGKNVYPFAGALVAVWDTLAMVMKLKPRKISVEFNDIKFFGQPVLQERKPLRLRVSLHRANGQFEVKDEDRKILVGSVRAEAGESARCFVKEFEPKEGLDLTEEDIYEMLYERDYFYSGEFRSIQKCNKSFTEAEIVWKDNWITGIDGIFQLHALRDAHDTLSQLSQVRKICINLEEHAKAIHHIEVSGKNTITAHVFELLNFARCGGILVEDVQFHKLPKLAAEPVSLKTLDFIPRFHNNVDPASALQIYMQMVAENINKDNINVLGILNSKDNLSIFSELRNILQDIPGVTVTYEQMRRDKVLVMRDQFLTEVDLVLVQNLSTDDSLCQMLYRVLRRDTFLINGEETIEDRIRPSALFRVISSKSCSDRKLDLVKWRPTQLTAASTIVTVRNKSELALLKGTRAELPQRHKLVILATYPPVSGLKDLVNQWRKESERNQIYLVMVSDKDNLDQLPDLDLAYNVLVDGIWGGEYYVTRQDRVTSERGVMLRSSRIGDLDSLHWVEAAEPAGPGVAVNVHYTAITDRDVKIASGVYPLRDQKDPAYCMDYSGVTDSGQRVMGVVLDGAASGRVKAHPELMWPVPEHWSLEDAVTVPSAYAHAFYIFNMKVVFRSGYMVLVHGAAGALGQAAISVAQALGCEVFATVSNIRKKRFLMKLFPKLKEEYIGNSRDPSFGDMIRIHTKSQGCNVVISCVKGELKNVSLNCVSGCGILIDTVQLQDQEPFAFGMNNLSGDRSYKTSDFSSIIRNSNVEDMKKLQILVSEGIARGYVRPLSRVTYEPSEVPRAFRFLSTSKHRGRVLLRLQDKIPAAEPRMNCSPELTHLVLCDQKLFSHQLVQRLIDRGAKKLILHCAHPSNNLKLKTQTWKGQGLEVHLTSEDLSSNKGIVKLLSLSSQLGPVEGIYVVATDTSEQTVDKMTDLTANLDLAARKLCPSVRYFAVISAGLPIGQQACLARERNGVPATMLNVLALRKPDDLNPANKGALSWRGTLDALERAVRSSEVILLAYPRNVPKETLMQQIANIADIDISEQTPENYTLLDLGLQVEKVLPILTFLKDTHSVALEEHSIPELTVQKIKEIEEAIEGTVFPKVDGLRTFFGYVDPDELIATTERVALPTLTNSVSARDDEFDVEKAYLCIIPGLEGHYRRFETICERLKVNAMILQPGLDRLNESLRDTAERYVKVYLKNLGGSKHFYLLGYENGVQIVLEVAAILEDHGLTGTVFCVGGTPEEFQEFLKQELSCFTSDEALQNAVARHMYSLMSGSAEGLEVLENASSWTEKIEVCVRTLLGRVPHSAQYAKNLIDAAYTRIKQAMSCRVQSRELKSKLILMHATLSNSEISPKELLQRYSQQPVTVYELGESLAHISKDLRCCSIINRHLSPDLLQAFEEMNHCDTYVTNTDAFMMDTLQVSNSEEENL